MAESLYDQFLGNSAGVESWEELYKWAIKNGKENEFFKKINEHAYILNLKADEELRAYTVRRLGEMKMEDDEEMRRERRRIKGALKSQEVRMEEAIEREKERKRKREEAENVIFPHQ